VRTYSGRWLARSALCLAVALVACGDATTNLIAAQRSGSGGGGAGGRDGGANDGGANDGGAGNDAAAGNGGAVSRDASAGDAGATGPCGDHVCACDDDLDNDNDNDKDGFDPECTGPTDDDESTFGTGRDELPRLSCQDCYWDNDVDLRDGCAYPQSCTDIGFPDPTGMPGCTECSVPQTCSTTCRNQTPNGCDCFGCCTVTRVNGRTLDVRLQASCSLEQIDNPILCPPCVRQDACFNACGACELCLGRKRRDLDKGCRGMPSVDEPTPVCDDDKTPCLTNDDCSDPMLFYCQQGCCLVRVW
jgi:hypothetical protein